MSDSCNGFSCGTGNGAISLPGDPSNNSILSAVGVYGGINLSWTYPTENPYGVSYIKVFRGITNDFSKSVMLVMVSASFYFDSFDEYQIKEYFYWIQIVSVNGTVGEVIGPVSAVPKPGIDNILQSLSGKIDVSTLAESLRQEVDRITTLSSELNNETQARLSQGAAIAEGLAALQAETDQAVVYVNQEVQARTEANQAIVQAVDALAVGLGQNQAAVAEFNRVSVDRDNALAQQITQAEVTLGEQVASVQTTIDTTITALEGTVQEIGALYTAKLTVNGLIGGFGVYNNGATVEAGFDVDKFWVGRTNSLNVKPFVIENGVVYMNQAIIKEGTIGSAQLAGTIQSDNYLAGEAGWAINRAGSAEFNNATFRGTLDVRSALEGARLEITNDAIKVYNDAGVVVVKIGDLSA